MSLLCHVFSLLYRSSFFFFNDTATTEIYTLSLHDALPISLPKVLRLTLERCDRPRRSRCCCWLQGAGSREDPAVSRCAPCSPASTTTRRRATPDTTARSRRATPPASART